ncbi:hypothetical protein [Rothia sp. ND6WE1A]|uniref:hypothetical protein n=1 Tax=Rothia sp. ND6WE1A TaxID=1848190 RepID=UPI000836CD38|nr:hypothetical protein [Rothia sp. ND6WE1A]SIK53544.1 Uncharacterised protein [Mycobacteroides abscessus subsp. abscessus]
MYLTQYRTQKKLVAPAVLSASLVATLLLSGCSDNSTDSAPAESSSSAASSSASTSSSTSSPSASASASQKASPSANAATSKAAENKESDSADAPSENYAGAEALSSAKSTDLSNEQVTKTQDLYSSYEKVLTAVGTVEVKSDKESDSASSAKEDNTNTPNLALDDKTVSDIEKVSTGSASDEFSANALEFGTNDWKQEGTSKIVGEPKVADSKYNGAPAKVLEVCIDSSDVKVKDSAGNTLTDPNTPKKSLNIFTLVEDNGSWKIASHDFPNNPDC